MRSPDSLKPGRKAPLPVEVVETRDEAALRAVYDPLAAAWAWPNWHEWKIGFTRSGRQYFLLRIDGTPAGLEKFIDHGDGELQIDNFGLTSEFIGRGFGGEALTQVIQSAWTMALRDRDSGVVWLHTCNWDHPHAVANYQARGFEVVATEPVEVSDARGYTLPVPS